MDTQSITLRIPGEGRSDNFWVWLRGQDMNPGDDDHVRLLVPWLREHCATLSRQREHLGGKLFLHQDVTAAVLAVEEAADLPVLQENLRDGALYVGDEDGERLLQPADAAKLFAEALRWCDADYHDLLPEFGDLVRQRLESQDKA